VVRALHRHGPRDLIVTVDAGTFAVPAYRHFPWTPPQRLMAPLSGAMGYGVPAAIATQLRHPDRRVVCLVGDGGFMMTGNEMIAAVERQLPILFILSNNASYASIRIHQDREYPGRHRGTSLFNPDFTALAAAFGMRSQRLERRVAGRQHDRRADRHEGAGLPGGQHQPAGGAARALGPLSLCSTRAGPGSPSTALPGPIVFSPVGELVLVHVDVELEDARLQPLLDIGHRPVVDQRSDLLQEEAQHRTGRDIADRLLEVLAAVTLDRCDRLRTRLLRDLDAQGQPSRFRCR
jgi:hypothetical protein